MRVAGCVLVPRAAGCGLHSCTSGGASLELLLCKPVDREAAVVTRTRARNRRDNRTSRSSLSGGII
jgi:hypothetical protein